MNISDERKPGSGAQESNRRMGRPKNVFEGVLISITPNTLIMKGNDGIESSMNLHEKIKASCDGIACDCSELKRGQKIRVFAQKKDLTVAIKIASLFKRAQFAPIA